MWNRKLLERLGEHGCSDPLISASARVIASKNKTEVVADKFDVREYERNFTAVEIGLYEILRKHSDTGLFEDEGADRGDSAHLEDFFKFEVVATERGLFPVAEQRHVGMYVKESV